MTLGFVLQVVVSGLAAGAVYGLVAIGFSLVYRLTRVVQLAHGDIVGASVFLALVLAAGSGPVTATNVSVIRYVAAVAAAVVVAGAVGGALYLGALRPFIRRGSAVGWIGATAAVAFAIQGILAASFEREAYVLPDPLPFSKWQPISLPGGASLPPRTLWILLAGSALAFVAGFILTRTRFGVAVSAIASEREGAQIVGLPVDRLTTLAFVLAGVLAAAAGVLGTPGAGAVGTQTGLLLGLKAIAASLAAGFGPPRRVFIAALTLGVFEAAITSLHVPGFPRLALGPAWRDVAPLLAALLFVTIRPSAEMMEPVD
ncbi:MAG: branched-chain amino acid ABC transporter permease [Actinomycetota bacterium]|nr:branched-chain amino acid ABC transporter permease [Actinomycetota bacterium]